MTVYVRYIGNRVCITWESGLFLLSDCEEMDTDLLRDCGVTKDHLLAEGGREVILSRKDHWKFVAAVIEGCC